MGGKTEVDHVTKIDTPEDAVPCWRCRDKPEAYQDASGVTLFHFCGDVMRIYANHNTLGECVIAWNKCQESYAK